MTQRPPTLVPSVIAPAMQVSTSPARSFSERLWQRFATLRGRFTMLLSAIVVITCLTTLAIALSSIRAYSDLNTIGTESIPSISAAQIIIPYQEDIDAHAADYLANTSGNEQRLCVSSITGQQLGLLSVHDCASRIIDTDLLQINQQLFLAGQNISFPGARTALEQTQAGLEAYVADINLMRYEYSQAANHSDPNDPHMQQAYQASHAAQVVLLQQLSGRVVNEPDLPSCMLDGQVLGPQTWPDEGIEKNMLCLSALGKPRLDTAYQDTVSFFGISLGIVFGLSIYSCIFIIWATWSMVTTTHKLFNLGLTVALLVTLFSTTIVLGDFDAIYGYKGDFSVIARAYNNVYTTGILEQESAQVQADQARWLEALSFHDPNANQWGQDGQAKSQQVATLLRTLSASSQPSQATPLLAKIQQDWSQYNAQAGQVAELANSAGSASSISQAESLHINGASAAFQTFTGDVQQLSALNKSDYAGIFADARDRLALLTTWWAIVFPVLGVIGAWGIVGRLKDF